MIDGRDDDAAWSASTPIDGFQQFDPVEGAEASMRTEARIAYDAANDRLFVTGKLWPRLFEIDVVARK